MLITGIYTADTLLGLAGDDTIFGWEGNDRILDSSGNNIVNGNEGNDTIYDGLGNDLLRGGMGDDILYGDKGDNTVFGDKDNDLIFVGQGNNIVNGNEGDDTIYGGSGNDLLRGGKNHDRIFGNAGEDTIYGDWGADTIAGMGGNDIFVIGRINSAIRKTTGGPNRKDADVITDFESGIDLISVTGGLSYADLDIQQGTEIDANNTIIKDKVTGEYLVVLLNNQNSNIGESIFIAEKAPISIFTDDGGYIGKGGNPTDRDTVNINAIALNELVKLPATIITIEDTDFVFSHQNSISFKDATLFNFPIKITIFVNNGTLTLNNTNGLTFHSGNNGSANMTFTGNITNINNAINKFTFTPERNFNGNASISVIAEMDSIVGCDTINISVIRINKAPVNTVPNPQTILQNAPLVFNLGNNNLISISDSDAGNNPIQVTLSTSNGTLSLSGINGVTFSSGNPTNSSSITFSGTISNINNAINGLTFTPTNNFIGNTNISITTNDFGNSGSGGAKITSSNIPISVGNANSIPVNQVPGKQITTANTPIIFNTANKKIISVSDSDAGNNPIQVTLTANNGNLLLNETTGLTFRNGTANNSSNITFNGTIFDINTALDGLIFTPENNFKGNDDIVITTNDLGNTGVGGSQIATNKIPITVNPYTVSITPQSSKIIAEGGSSKFKLSRDGTVGDLPLSLTIDSSSTVTSFAGGAFPIDYTLSGGSVTIGSPNKMTVTIPDGKSFVDVTVTANKDSHAEADETLKLNFANTGNYNIDATKNNSTITINGGGTVVTSTKDDASLNNYAFVEGSLRQAIENATLNWQAEDTITFNLPQTSPKITLTGKLRRIFDTLTIDGPANKVTIDGDNQYQIFDVYNTKATFNNLIVINGKGDRNKAGGIHIEKSEVIVSNSIFSENTSTDRGGAIHNRNSSTLKVIDTTFDNNSSSSFTGGGAISNSGNLTITNSTISNNSAFAFVGGGGGIANDGTIAINNSTIAKNYTDNSGGGIYNAGTVTASNTIISDNIDSGSSPDFDGTLESSGYNLIGNDTGTKIIGDTTGNILNKSAKLDSLKDNGGLTRTIALLAGSPAINAGDPHFNAPNLFYDQRGVGFDRILQNRIDIGAFESNF